MILKGSAWDNHRLASDGSCAREQTAVDRVNDWRGVYHPAAKVSSVQALDRILPALNLIELEIDIALRIGID